MNEARGGADALIWDGKGVYIITFLKPLALFSGKYITHVYHVLVRYTEYISDSPEGLWQSITSGRLVHTSDTENICTIPSILRVTL